jgi:imidazole glycerol-phosphate synthase subunit HisF
MLKKRVIFTLLYDSGSFMLSRNFRLQKVGDLLWLKKNYDFSKIAFSIDELIILDVTRSVRDEEKFHDHVRSLTEECFVPIAAGGGIRTVEQARKLLHSGADKIVVNTLVSESTEVIEEIAEEFGQQCIVVSVDAKLIDGKFTVWTNNGVIQQEANLMQWLGNIIRLPIGELYLNSIAHDGTGQGYCFSLLDDIPDSFNIPVILAGGAGKFQHLFSGLSDGRVDAVATANLFNFIGDGLSKARERLYNEGCNLSYWNLDDFDKITRCI